LRPEASTLLAVLPRLAKIILLLALACSIGLHWAFFQSVAWTSMLAGNLRRDSLAQAVAHTFDGQHPCQICKAIAAGKKSEKKSESAPHFKSFEFPPASKDFVLTIPASFGLPVCADLVAESLSESPPTPPPRAALA
jgi:hypothetical protein